MGFWKNCIWILYMVSFFTLCLGVPSYMSAISLVVLCILIMSHLYGRETKGLWIFQVVVDGLLFVYAYLNMFTLISDFIYPKSFFESLHFTKVEVGLFVTSDIVAAVSKCEVFFYFLPFFIRIVIGASRILYFNVTLVLPYNIGCQASGKEGGSVRGREILHLWHSDEVVHL